MAISIKVFIKSLKFIRVNRPRPSISKLKADKPEFELALLETALFGAMFLLEAKNMFGLLRITDLCWRFLC